MQRIDLGKAKAGRQWVNVDVTRWQPGIYSYRLTAVGSSGTIRLSKRMLVLQSDFSCSYPFSPSLEFSPLRLARLPAPRARTSTRTSRALMGREDQTTPFGYVLKCDTIFVRKGVTTVVYPGTMFYFASTRPCTA